MSFSLGTEHHTYTIIGRCPRTGRLGIGIATYSLAVGGYCPFIKSSVAALSTQAYASPRLGPVAMGLLEAGRRPDEVIGELEKDDNYFDYRQIGIVDRHGAAAAHSGSKTRKWAGHILGDGFVAMGNALAGAPVIQAMAEAFKVSEAEELDERSLRAIEAGREAGGQGHLRERSAGLMVHDPDQELNLDLRVDAHESAIDELRRVHTAYTPYVAYYELRARDPDSTPPQEEWAREQGIEP